MRLQIRKEEFACYVTRGGGGGGDKKKPLQVTKDIHLRYRPLEPRAREPAAFAPGIRGCIPPLTDASARFVAE